MVKYTHLKEKKQLKSILLVFLLVATYIVVVLPLTTPNVSAQIVHLESAALEDWVGPPTPPNIYDLDPTPGVVQWDPNEDHIVSHLNGYTIEAGMTLNIPAMDSAEHVITFQGFSSRKIDVYGTLITNFGGLMPPKFTTFTGPSGEGWEGIIFRSGSQGCIVSTIIKDALQGVVFEPGSTLMNPGVYFSTFENCGSYGLRMDGASGFTSISDTTFDDGSNQTTISLDLANGHLDMNNVFFYSHNRGDPGLHITNASVNAYECWFNGLDEPGNMVLIEGGSNGTVLNRCAFMNGLAGEYYIRVDGSSILIINSRFVTSDGARSIIANENASGIPAHPILLNPTGENPPGGWSDTFDNSSMNATGNSSITLKWYMDVFVKDPNGDPIDNAPVWVNDSLGNPAEPPSKTTDANGWARWFVVTELIKYNDSVDNFNPFNVSAEASLMKGYADPEPIMNMSREVNVTVPFNPDNVLPIVSMITTPVGVQSGFITIDYMLEDPNPWDDGNMSIIVDYSTDGVSWYPAISGPGSDLDYLYNDTLYHFIWDSSLSLGHIYSTTVYLRITPRDGVGNGTPSQTGSFTVDNKAPIVSWLPTPVGVQSGLITIQYRLEDPNPDDDGSLSVEVFFSMDNVSWLPASQAGGNPTTGLNNDTLYTFIWGSTYSKQLEDVYNTTVYIQIIPYDRAGNGTPGQTGNFTVDNEAPMLISGPIVTVTNTTATIVWEMHESCNATVWYGLDPDLTDEASNNSGTTTQWVTLTNLEPGRIYTYVINSTDIIGHKYSSYGNDWNFVTEVRIQLYEGWNMISVPANLTDYDLEIVLASIDGDWDTIWCYDAFDSADPWKLYDTNNPIGSDLEFLFPGRGMWIHLLSDTVLMPNHEVPLSDFEITMELFQGWNLIGYPSVTTRPIDDALSGVQYDVIKTYDAATDQWLSYDGSTGDLTQMEMGRGYWIYATEFSIWSLPYAE